MASQASLPSPKEWVLRSSSWKRQHPCCCFSLCLHPPSSPPAPPSPPPSVLPAAPPALRCCFPWTAPRAPDWIRQWEAQADPREGGGEVVVVGGIFSSPSLLQSLPGPISLGASHTMSPPPPSAPEGATASCCHHLWAPRCLVFISCPYICPLSLKAFSFKPGVSNFGPQAKCLLPAPPPKPTPNTVSPEHSHAQDLGAGPGELWQRPCVTKKAKNISYLVLQRNKFAAPWGKPSLMDAGSCRGRGPVYHISLENVRGHCFCWEFACECWEETNI